jgi:hypothetical protein
MANASRAHYKVPATTAATLIIIIICRASQQTAKKVVLYFVMSTRPTLPKCKHPKTLIVHVLLGMDNVELLFLLLFQTRVKEFHPIHECGLLY